MSQAALTVGVDEVQAVLRERNPRAPAAEIKTMARIVSIAVDVMSGFPSVNLRGVAREDKLRAALEQVARQFLPVEATQDEPIERTRGSGLGAVISLGQGRARITAYAAPKAIEDWAGPVGGASDVEAQIGVKRTTLNSWYKQNAVIGLLRGQRKLAYPIEQFVDGRPLQGIADILAVAPDARSAWLWMRQPHGALDGGTPLAALHAGQQDRVSAIAQRDFTRETD